VAALTAAERTIVGLKLELAKRDHTIEVGAEPALALMIMLQTQCFRVASARWAQAAEPLNVVFSGANPATRAQGS
jgi:hypothetical protein